MLSILSSGNFVALMVATALILMSPAVILLLVLHHRLKDKTVLGAIGPVAAAAILASVAFLSTERVLDLLGDGSAKDLRKRYAAVIGDDMDRSWRLIVATPPVFKGLTSSEDSLFQVLQPRSDSPLRVLDLPAFEGFPYRKAILSTDQYLGGGEGAGCFFFGQLFACMRIELDVEWRPVREPPVGPAIILGSRNVTSAKPELFGLSWYAEDGYVYERREHQSVRVWAAEYDSLLNVTVDYGILSRVLSPQGRTIIICEGIHSYGTYGVIWEFLHGFELIEARLEHEQNGKALNCDQQFQVLFRIPVYGPKPRDAKIIGVRIW